MRKRILLYRVLIVILGVILPSLNISIQTKADGRIWSLTINATETNLRSDTVEFGEASDAFDGPLVDPYDILKPPTPIQPYLRMFLNDNHRAPYDTLWKDFRQYPGLSKTWNLSVQWMPDDFTSSTNVTISWDPNDFDNSEYGMITICNDTGAVLQNMRMNRSYSFSCPALLIQNFKIICTRGNTKPDAPTTPGGETSGYHGFSYNYSTSSVDPDGDALYFLFDWGDSITSNWLGPYQSNQLVQTSYLWETPGDYQVKVKARDIHGNQGNWSTILPVEMINRVPLQPSNPSPLNGASNIKIDPFLSWTGGDPDDDFITADVYFGSINPPMKLVDNQSSSSFHPGNLRYQTTYYWRIITWDGFGGSMSGPLWSFTTRSIEDGSQNLPDNDTNQTDQSPIADASLSEQTGFVGSLLVFNGSRSLDPDGYLTKWSWVTLIVTDDSGLTGTDTISVGIQSANQPPTKPILNGTRTGIKNKPYLYTMYATDLDNDFLQYSINWGDETQNTSVFMPNGSTWSISHSWSKPGKYQIIGKATDNTSFSEQTTIDIFIDVTFVGPHGFLFDADENGQIDSFYNNNTGSITSVQRSNDGSYYLDTNNDGKWDYLYNPSTGSLTPLSSNVTTIENPLIFIIIIVIAILIIGCIVYLYKKNYF